MVGPGKSVLTPIAIFPGILGWTLLWMATGCAIPAPGSAPELTSLHREDPNYAVRYRILSTAEQLLGTPYVLGGNSPAGIDCSGLVRYAYLQAGIKVPRTTEQLYRAGKRLDFVKPGDLLFFRTDPPSVSHVGIYVGKGQMIHASTGNHRVIKVELNQPYWRQRLAGGATFLDY